MRHTFTALLGVVLMLPAIGAAPIRGDDNSNERTAAELFPASSAAYVEIAEPKQLLATVLEHPLRPRVEEIEDVRNAIGGANGFALRVALAYVEAKLDRQWRSAIESLTAGGAYAVFDPETEGVAVLVKSDDAEFLQKAVTVLVQLARDDAKNKKNPDPFKQREYRELTAYETNEKAIFVVLGDWLLASNKGELAKAIADEYLDAEGETLASSERFQAARKKRESKTTLWGFLDLAAARKHGIEALQREKSDNPGVEMLVAGLDVVARNTPYVTVTLDVTDKHVALASSAPFDSKWAPQTREFYFGPDAKGVAPAAIHPKNELFNLGAYRDLSEFWLAKEELFTEEVVAGLAEADSGLSTLFAGLSVGEDVLGAVKPEMQIVAARQDYSKLETPAPDIKIPAGAFVFELKEPEKMQRRLKVAFQSVMGFANIGLAMEGQPQLDVNSEKRGEATIVSATYIPEEEHRDGLLVYNFSPTIAYEGERFVFASTRELAEELLTLKAEEQPTGENVRANVDWQVFTQVLQDNREQLVAQNMLENGNTKAAAEKEINTLLKLMEAGKEARLSLRTEEKQVTLELELKFQKE